MNKVGKALSNVISVWAENDKGYNSIPKVMFVENILYDDGTIKKNIVTEENPMYTFYSTHHLHVNETAAEKKARRYTNYVKKEDCKKYTVPFIDLYKEMAKVSNRMEFYQDCISNGRRKDLQSLNKDIDFHLTDMQLSDYKIRQWIEENKDATAIPLSKAFFDIEVDNYGYEGFPLSEIAPCPVSLISYIYEPTMTIHSFILLIENNDSQKEFLEHFAECKNEYISALLDEFNSSNKDNKYKKVQDIRFHIYDSEKELIEKFFLLVKRDKPDFLGA
jgi:hypothetical protein